MIDIDCIESDRPKIFKYIISRFGEEHTARVSSFGTDAELATIDDIIGGFHNRWVKHHQDQKDSESPWSLKFAAKVKEEYNADPANARQAHPEVFRYFDGLLSTRVSQSVHPAGMVISPLNLAEEYGVFYKDGEQCLFLDMDELHDVGAAKYDFLILKTVKVINDTCKYIGQKYPRTHEINWEDQEVWKDMLKTPGAVFQFEGNYAFESLRKFKPQSIFDMSLVTACIRPSGASYRDDLLRRKPHHNPSEIIDKLLEDNYGFLVYQEEVIAFLQQICGLSGSQADTIRRGIARKKPEILEKSLPEILDGYCAKSDHPREVAERECQEFLQIISDASSYMF